MPIRAAVVIPECAHTCPLVRMLLLEITVLRGSTETVQRSNHAMRPIEPDPDPSASPMKERPSWP